MLARSREAVNRRGVLRLLYLTLEMSNRLQMSNTSV